jgi:hypothetical protein
VARDFPCFEGTFYIFSFPKLHHFQDTTRTLMPSCVFSSESAKLDAEQRQQQAEEDAAESREIDQMNRVSGNNHETRSRSTSSTNLAIQSVYSDESKAQVSTCFVII